MRHPNPNYTVSSNRYRFSGKEDQTTGDLQMQDFGARFLGKKLPVWGSVDPLAEKYYSISPYAYCANNPIRYIDPTGMYFDDSNEKKAQRLEKKIDNRIAKLENKIVKLHKKGETAGDIYVRIGELEVSKTDISSMRDDKNTEYRYARASSRNNEAGRGKPSTDKTGTNNAGHNVITMYTDSNTGNRLHETRHGGQIALRLYSFDQSGHATSGYTSSSEVSAYRAQYAYDGKLNYIDASSELNQRIVAAGGPPPISTVTNINSILAPLVSTKLGEVQTHITPSGTSHSLEPLYKYLK